MDHPRLKIGVLTQADYNYLPVANVTFPVNEAYCRFHGYTWIAKPFLEKDPVPRIEPYSWAEIVWSKIPLMKEYLGEYDWLIWIDADAMATNHTIRLERIIESSLFSANLIICRDEHGLNSAVFLIRNCQWSHEFLKLVDQSKEEFISHRYPEQEAMSAVLDEGENDGSVSCLPPWILNQFWCTWIPGDFIVHHAGGSVEDKVKGLTPFLEKVQYATPSPSSPVLSV